MMAEPAQISVAASREGFVDEKKLLACIHCGLCLPSCPTHVISGHEMPSPRGRLYLMRAVAEDRLPSTDPYLATHEWTCLVCRACETACPSGVEFGYLMEQTREQLNATRRPSILKRFIYTRLLPNRTLLKAMQSSLAVLSAVRLFGALRALGRAIQRIFPRFAASLRLLPDQVPFPRSLPEEVSSSTTSRGTIGLLLGCVGDVFTASINDKTIAVLTTLGYTVKTLPELVCCGALSIHAGFRKESLELARRAMDEVERAGVDYLISNIAGCGAMLKDYEKLFEGSPTHSRARAFRARVRDISEFLLEHHAQEIAAWRYPRGVTVSYQAPCHLYHAQKITDAPLQLLRLIGNVEAGELNENELCCGSAGSYNIEHPKESEALLARKLLAIDQQKPELVVTANAGCLMQISKGLREANHQARAQHIIEVLHTALNASTAGSRSSHA